MRISDTLHAEATIKGIGYQDGWAGELFPPAHLYFKVWNIQEKLWWHEGFLGGRYAKIHNNIRKLRKSASKLTSAKVQCEHIC